MEIVDKTCHCMATLSSMQTMNVCLPDPLSEYVRELIRDDEKRKAEERLEALLIEGLEGEESELTRQDFDNIRKEALTQLKRPPQEEGLMPAVCKHARTKGRG